MCTFAGKRTTKTQHNEKGYNNICPHHDGCGLFLTCETDRQSDQSAKDFTY